MPEPVVSPNPNPAPRPTPPGPNPPGPQKPAPPKPGTNSGSLDDIFKASGGNLEAARARMAEYKSTFKGSIPDQIYSNWVDEFFPGRAFGIELAKQWSK